MKVRTTHVGRNKISRTTKDFENTYCFLKVQFILSAASKILLLLYTSHCLQSPSILPPAHYLKEKR